MRFHRRFGEDDGRLRIFGACFFVLILLVEKHPSWTDKGLAITWAFIAVVTVLDQRFWYWELRPDCLLERRFWSKKEVALETVTRVRLHTLWGHTSDDLEVDFARQAAKSGRGRVLVDPREREQFIAALRGFAPQAKFDL